MCLKNKITVDQIVLLYGEYSAKYGCVHFPKGYEREYSLLRNMMKNGAISWEQGLELTHDKDKLKRFYCVAYLVSSKRDDYHLALDNALALDVIETMKIFYFHRSYFSEKNNLKRSFRH